MAILDLPDYLAHEIVSMVFRGDWAKGGPTDKDFSQMHEEWLEETYGKENDAEKDAR